LKIDWFLACEAWVLVDAMNAIPIVLGFFPQQWLNPLHCFVDLTKSAAISAENDVGLF